MKITIEIPEGSKEKIEIKNGIPTVDRLLKSPIPANYGFINNTLAEDGDALDIFVVSHEPLKTSQEVEVEILGMFDCTDQGIPDNKLFGVLTSDKFHSTNVLVKLAQVENYLSTYKAGFDVNDYKSFSLKSEVNDLVNKYKV